MNTIRVPAQISGPHTFHDDSISWLHDFVAPLHLSIPTAFHSNNTPETLSYQVYVRPVKWFDSSFNLFTFVSQDLLAQWLEQQDSLTEFLVWYRQVLNFYLHYCYLYLQFVQRSEITNKNQLPNKSNIRVPR